MLGESLLVHGIAKPSSEQSEACAQIGCKKGESLDHLPKSLLRDSVEIRLILLSMSMLSRRPQSICQRLQGGACLRHRKLKSVGIP